jgi:hypothetical protein
VNLKEMERQARGLFKADVTEMEGDHGRDGYGK